MVCPPVCYAALKFCSSIYCDLPCRYFRELSNCCYVLLLFFSCYILFLYCILSSSHSFVQACVAVAAEDHRLVLSLGIPAVWLSFLAALSLLCLEHLTVAI